VEHPDVLLAPYIPFMAVFDQTDHFHFACPHCKEVAEVVKVERDDRYAHTPTIYFYLHCLKCGARNFRKIYLEDSGKHFLYFPSTIQLLAKNPEECKSGIIKR
jgi:C4-type Zn-finger protein